MKKIKWFLKKECCLRDNLPHFEKNQKKNWWEFENFIEKMAYFPAIFWANKILNLYFGLIVVNCHTGHINEQNPAWFFKICSVVPEIICRPFEKKSFREKRV